MNYSVKNIITYCFFLFFLTGEVLADSLFDAQQAYLAGDYAKAKEIILPLAEEGNVLAQYNLAVIHISTPDSIKNYQEAMKWFHLASLQGDADAQVWLGVMYDQGQGVTQDYQEAIKWYRLASLQGHIDAQFRLGVMYDQGQGVTQDYQEAIKWYRLAAEHGSSGAQASLGIMYGQGQGVSKDDIRAYMWLDLAASQGVNLAEHGRNLLAEKMTISQINEAQKKTMNCKNSDYKNCD